MVRKPVDPEEELRWMAQEVRGYVEAVLNSLAANVPKVFYSSILIFFLVNYNFGSCGFACLTLLEGHMICQKIPFRIES